MVKFEYGVRVRVNIDSRTCVRYIGTLSFVDLEIIMALIRLFFSKELGVFGDVVCATISGYQRGSSIVEGAPRIDGVES